MKKHIKGNGPPGSPPTLIYLGTGLAEKSEMTFSELAYRGMARELPWLPKLSDLDTVTIEVPSNASIIPELLKHPDAYAVLPIHTMAGGRIDESIFSLAMLPVGTPVTALMSYKMRVSFSMFGNTSIDLQDAVGVLGHPRALQACKQTITELGLDPVPVDNNATGLRMVQTQPAYKRHVALGPHVPVAHLEVKREACEDTAAYTTFLLLHNGIDNRDTHPRSKVYGSIIAFEIDDIPGQLAKVLTSFRGWNWKYLQSVYDSNLLGYRFVGEIECGKDQRVRLARDIMTFTRSPDVSKLVSFGPFPIQQSGHITFA